FARASRRHREAHASISFLTRFHSSVSFRSSHSIAAEFTAVVILRVSQNALRADAAYLSTTLFRAASRRGLYSFAIFRTALRTFGSLMELIESASFPSSTHRASSSGDSLTEMVRRFS